MIAMHAPTPNARAYPFVTVALGDRAEVPCGGPGRTLRLPPADPRPLPRLTWEQRPLTAREIEVLGWVALGKCDWQVGEILMISEKTVNYHVERSKTKLKAATRLQAVLKAVELGLLPLSNGYRLAGAQPTATPGGGKSTLQ